MVERLPATAALWVRMQTSPKIQNGQQMQRSGHANTLKPAKKYKKDNTRAFKALFFLCYFAEWIDFKKKRFISVLIKKYEFCPHSKAFEPLSSFNNKTHTDKTCIYVWYNTTFCELQKLLRAVSIGVWNI